jgi:uncharacterized protein YcfL
VKLEISQTAKKITAFVSIAAVLLLAGCSSPTAAFTVGKKSTPISDIQKSIDNILASRKTVDITGMNLQNGSALIQNQVQFFLISQLLADTSNSLGIKVTAAEVATAKDAATKQVGGDKALPKALVGAGIDPKTLDLYFTSVLYSQKLAAYAKTAGTPVTSFVTAIASKEGVTVNPRYGKWDPKTANLVPADTTAGAVKTK